MKSINVVAAIIIDGDKVLATQRADGDFKGGLGISWRKGRA